MNFDFDVEILSDRWGLTFDSSVLTFRNFIIVQFKQKQVIKTQFQWNEEQLLSFFLYLCDIIIWKKSIETGNFHFKSLSHSVMGLKLIEKHSYENKTIFLFIFNHQKIKILIH